MGRPGTMWLSIAKPDELKGFIGKSERRARMMREELQALRQERLQLMRELQFVVDHANRESLRSAALETELAETQQKLSSTPLRARSLLFDEDEVTTPEFTQVH